LVRPILEAGDQPCANRVIQNVVGLFREAFVAAQAMIKKVTLPMDTGVIGTNIFSNFE